MVEWGGSGGTKGHSDRWDQMGWPLGMVYERGWGSWGARSACMSGIREVSWQWAKTLVLLALWGGKKIEADPP